MMKAELAEETVPATAVPRDIDAMLVEFVRDRDVACPRCGYNLRNLARPVCPECDEPLKLHVSAHRPQLVWLLLTLAPGAFCAIAFAIFVVLCAVLGPPPLVIEGVLTVCFLGFSGLFTVLLAGIHRRFLRLSTAAQATWMLGVWSVNLLAFTLSVTTV